MSKTEKVLEGKYNYFTNGRVYTEENFKVEREGGRQGTLNFHAEVLSRVKTGEFLKVYIEYQVNNSFDPTKVKIIRQLGEKKSTESFHIDLKTKNYSYSFEGDGKKNYFNKVLTSKPHIATPCFLTSMIMINQKKLDPVHRTPYIILSSNNIWEYKGEFLEKETYVELQDLEPQKLRIKGSDLKASHCKLLSVNESGTISNVGHDIYLSKYYYIPYQGKFSNDVEITIENLKNYEEQLNKHM